MGGDSTPDKPFKVGSTVFFVMPTGEKISGTVLRKCGLFKTNDDSDMRNLTIRVTDSRNIELNVRILKDKIDIFGIVDHVFYTPSNIPMVTYRR
jgi:hypothetical protein